MLLETNVKAITIALIEDYAEEQGLSFEEALDKIVREFFTNRFKQTRVTYPWCDSPWKTIGPGTSEPWTIDVYCSSGEDNNVTRS